MEMEITLKVKISQATTTKDFSLLLLARPTEYWLLVLGPTKPRLLKLSMIYDEKFFCVQKRCLLSKQMHVKCIVEAVRVG